jgi:hypothetical protein
MLTLCTADLRTSHLLTDFKASSALQKNVSVPRWYEQFSQVGLCYGPIFRGMSKILAVGSTSMAAATINPHPTSNLMKNESRYIIHPATLDAALQLLILASHKNTPHIFKKAYMPVGFETLNVWPHNPILEDGTTNTIAKGYLKGVRGLSADLTICGSDELPFLSARNVFFIASDQTAQVIDNKNGPYTRMVWKPQFSQLDDSKIANLHPPVTLEDNAVIPSLNNLALHQLIHFKATNALIFKNGSQVSSVNARSSFIQITLSRFPTFNACLIGLSKSYSWHQMTHPRRLYKFSTIVTLIEKLRSIDVQPC